MINRAERDRQYKIYFFLITYFVFALVKVIASISVIGGGRDAAPNALQSLIRVGNPLLTAALWGASLMITMSTDKRKVFHSRAVIFLFTGISIWLIWGAFLTFSRLSVFGGIRAYREFLALAVFTHLMFMSARIIEIYDLRRKVVQITFFCVAFTILGAFIVYFDGFSFFSSISNLFMASGRYRYAYGFNHYNTAGYVCLQFFVYVAIYGEVLREDEKQHKIRSVGKIRYLFYLPAAIISLTSASRASISGLILFFMVYLCLTIYQRARSYFKFILITLIVYVIFMLIISVDWWLIWDVFWYNRGVNYRGTLPYLTLLNAWMTGIGFLKPLEIAVLLNMPFLDSFYLLTLLMSGLIGFAIFWGTIFIFTFAYFQDVKHMTKLQKLAGGLLAIILYRALFESSFWGHGPFDLLNWIIIIICMNDRSKPHTHIHSDEHSRT